MELVLLVAPRRVKRHDLAEGHERPVFDLVLEKVREDTEERVADALAVPRTEKVRADAVESEVEQELASPHAERGRGLELLWPVAEMDH
eukprot:9683122-Lingulodinium_polyedra.AAC.2